MSDDTKNHHHNAPTLDEAATVAPLAVDAATIDADWDDAATLEVLTLPSGKHVQVRPVSLLSMIANDALPNELLAAAQRSIGLGAEAAASAAAQEMEARDGVKLIDLMVCEMCVRPAFVNKPPSACGPGERSVHGMWDSDKTWLFNTALRGQHALKSGGGQ